MTTCIHVLHAWHCPEEFGIVEGARSYVQANGLEWQVMAHGCKRNQLPAQLEAMLKAGDVLIGRRQELPSLSKLGVHYVEWLNEGASQRGDAAVSWDAASIGRAAACYLRSVGVRSFAIKGPLDRHATPQRSARQRAFIDACRSLGFDAHVVADPDQHQGITLQQHQAMLAAFVASTPGPIGFFLYHDHMAQYLVEELDQIGIRVPEQVLVVGGSGNATSTRSRIPVSSVRLPFHELGARAALQAQRLLSGTRPPLEQVAAFGVIERNSTRACYSDPVIRRAVARVDMPDRPIPKVKELAQACRVSRQVLLVHMRRTFHCPTESWLTGRAMQRAAELLAETDLTTATVAERCGISQRANLSRSFKAHYGITPTAYRQGVRRLVKGHA